MQEMLNAIASARAAHHFDLMTRLETELKITKFIIRHALRHGFTVSVNDGEEWVLKRSGNTKTIMEAMFSTDENRLTIQDKDGKKIVSILLIYGNEGWDVVSDWSAPDLKAVEWFMGPISDYASKFERR